MKISLCIPTRERAEFLRACLATVVAIDDPALEIIVSDNASADETRAVVDRFADPRIRYLNSGERLSMRQNFERAVDASTGDYVIVIGDDDAMVPGQFPLLRAILAAERPECLSWRSRYYLWPDPRQPDGGGRLKLTRAQLFGTPQPHASTQIIEAIAGARLGGHDVVPMIYHGAVRRDVIERLRARAGALFACSVPDVYFQVAANAVISEVLFVEHPLSIQAISPKSTGFSARFAGTSAAGQAVQAFAREAEADPIADPMPGHLPAIELYWLNAVEQANRMIFAGRLPIAYAAYIRRALVALAERDPAEWASGCAALHRLVDGIASGQDALRQQIEAARPSGAVSRFGRRLDVRLKSLRRFQPSTATAARGILDLKRLGLGPVDDAARVIDYCLGAHDGIVTPSPERRAALQAQSMMRMKQLCRRTWFGQDLPDGFGDHR